LSELYEMTWNHQEHHLYLHLLLLLKKKRGQKKRFL
jgi:hypothetical protein